MLSIVIFGKYFMTPENIKKYNYIIFEFYYNIVIIYYINIIFILYSNV